MAKKQKGLTRQVSFSMWSVLLFVVAFALFGAAALYYSLAAPLQQNSGVCNMTSPISVGQNYSGTVTNLPTNTVLNMFTTYGDGSTFNYVLGVTDSGSWNIGGYPAKVTGATTFKITGKTKNNPKLTPVYATCGVQVN